MKERDLSRPDPFVVLHHGHAGYGLEPCGGLAVPRGCENCVGRVGIRVFPRRWLLLPALCPPRVGVCAAGVPTVVAVARRRCLLSVVGVVAVLPSPVRLWLWLWFGRWVLAFPLVCWWLVVLVVGAWASHWLWLGKWVGSRGARLLVSLRCRAPCIGTCPGLLRGGLLCSPPGWCPGWWAACGCCWKASWKVARSGYCCCFGGPVFTPAGCCCGCGSSRSSCQGSVLGS